jgi:hypothetical protein
MLDTLPEVPGYRELDLADWTREFPLGGMHFDLDRRTAGIWCAAAAEEIENRASRALPGLTITWWKDRFEQHLEIAGGGLVFPVQETESLLDSVVTTLLGKNSDNSDLVLKSVALLTKGDQSTDVQVNPFALRDDSIPIHRETRERILGEAIRHCSSTYS